MSNMRVEARTNVISMRVFVDLVILDPNQQQLLFSNHRMISVRAAPTAEAADTPQDSLMNAIRW